MGVVGVEEDDDTDEYRDHTEDYMDDTYDDDVGHVRQGGTTLSLMLFLMPLLPFSCDLLQRPMNSNPLPDADGDAGTVTIAESAMTTTASTPQP